MKAQNSDLDHNSGLGSIRRRYVLNRGRHFAVMDLKCLMVGKRPSNNSGVPPNQNPRCPDSNGEHSPTKAGTGVIRRTKNATECHLKEKKRHLTKKSGKDLMNSSAKYRLRGRKSQKTAQRKTEPWGAGPGNTPNGTRTRVGKTRPTEARAKALPRESTRGTL